MWVRSTFSFYNSMITNSFSRLIVLATIASVAFVACQKGDEDGIDPTTKNNVSIEFENRVGDQKLVPGATFYKNASGEEFTVTTFNYFVSNISLKNENGTVQQFPNQYFLIRQADPKSQVIQLKDVPSGNYSEMSFMIGVDSVKSISPITERVGALDVTNYGDDGMYWSWNSGYIFLKIEGTSPVVPVRSSGQRSYQIHVGGYGGGFDGGKKMTNNLRTVTLPISSKATVRGNIAPEIHVLTDAKKIFDGPAKISLATTNNVHNPDIAAPVADNYKTMFLVDHVHNEKQ